MKLEEIVTSNKLVLVKFEAEWCGPCKTMSAILEKFAPQNPDIKIVKVDIDEEPLLASENKILSIPTIIAYNDGVEVGRKVGVTTKIRELFGTH